MTRPRLHSYVLDVVFTDGHGYGGDMRKHESRSAETTLPLVPPPPPASSEAARSVMRGNSRVVTRPERALRSLLHRRGLRFRVDVAPEPHLRCQADIVFRRARVAVFVDGCFWHGCPEHGTQPVTNSEYWRAKIARNVARDRRNDAALQSQGWTVVRVWEHERPEDGATRVMAAIRQMRGDGRGQSNTADPRDSLRAPAFA